MDPRKQNRLNLKMERCLYFTNEFRRSAKSLIEQGANINAKKNSGETVLMIACALNLQDLVEMLVSKGVNIDNIDQFGATALMYACHNGHLEIAKILIENGANIRIKNFHQRNYFWYVPSSKKEEFQNYINSLSNIKPAKK